MKRILASPAVLFLACLLFRGAPAAAQSKGADLSGAVRDSSGAVMARVTVTARALATNHARQASTDDHGRYAFPGLEVGRQRRRASGPPACSST
jgi:hypothetical protein